jgi:hypothetical protein
MKILKTIFRYWIAIASLGSFMGGWILFSRAGKPAALFSTGSQNSLPMSMDQGSNLSPLPTLAPIPSLNDLVGNTATLSTTTTSNFSLQPLPSLPSLSASGFLPRIRTSGS